MIVEESIRHKWINDNSGEGFSSSPYKRILKVVIRRAFARRFSCVRLYSCVSKSNEQAHNKTYNKTCVTSNDSDQPMHPLGMARVLVHPSLDSHEAVKSTCDQRRL